MGKGWWNNSSSWGWKKRRSWGGSRYNRYRPWDYDTEDDIWSNREELRRMLGILNASQAGPSQSSQSVVSEVEEEDEMGHDELDDEICFGTLRGNIVGLQYYRGTVNKKEMVALEREPENRYDINAIKVKNVGNIQVGHIKRELAKPLAFIMDKGLARLEGVVPFGYTNVYSMPVDITLWGKPEHQSQSVDKLKSCGFYLTGGTQQIPSSQGEASSSEGPVSFSYGVIQPRRTFLTPAEVKNELDKLFETIQEGDKTSLANAAEAIVTPLYPHQKQALNWMIKRENSTTLPPFWEERAGKYFNTVLNFTTNIRPESVRGGILADDMGLGKTLEMITLIVTNFVDNQPLARPVQGLVRQSRLEKMAVQKAKVLPVGDEMPAPMKVPQLRLDKRISTSCHTDRLAALSSPSNIDSPRLPQLPNEEEDEESSISDDDDDEDAISIPSINEKTMVAKDDPDFSPVMKNKSRKSKSKENVSPKVTSASRPRRSVKRPARYTYSSEEDELINEETPKKKAKEGSEQKCTSRSSRKMLETEHIQNISTAKSELGVSGKGKTPANGKRNVKKGKGKGRRKILEQAPENSVGDVNDKAVAQSTNEESVVMDTATDCKNVTEVKEQVKLEQTVSKMEETIIEKKDDKAEVKAEVSKLKKEEEVTFKKEENNVVDLTAEDDIEELPDLDDIYTIAPEKTELPDILAVSQSVSYSGDAFSSTETVVMTRYTKAELKDVGESTGRTASNGRRCTLIVCPLSVLSNWLDQLEDHVHRNVHLSIYLYYGSGRTKDSNLLENQDIVITTYSTVSADFKKGARNPLQKVKWLRVVLDEGHSIKNPAAQQTKAILELDAQRKWVLTGTPIQNSMKDLWSLINFLKVNPFTDKQWWRRTIERPLEKGDESALKRVQHLMGLLALRRTKTQQVNGKPLVQLPERSVFIEHVKLSEEERKVYDSMQNEGKLIVSKYFKQGTLLHNYGDVLAILMRLRQLCCHPFLVAKAAEAVKDTLAEIDKNGGVINEELRQKLIDRLMMVLGSGTDEECAVCLDALKAPVITHCAHVFCRPCIESVIKNERPQPKCPLCRGAIEDDKLLEVPPEEMGTDDTTGETSSITADTWKSSAKVDALMSALLTLRAEDPSVKSLVVSQFTSLFSLLEIPLRINGFRFVRLDGTMNTKARTQAIEEFSDPTSGSPTVFLLSLKAGGVGINLTAASRVFLIDPAWNPASEEQCFDRCHRLGQTKDVVITKFIVEDSVEERMLTLQEKKRQLMQGAFGQKQTAEEKRQARIRDIKTLFNF